MDLFQCIKMAVLLHNKVLTLRQNIDTNFKLVVFNLLNNNFKFNNFNNFKFNRNTFCSRKFFLRNKLMITIAAFILYVLFCFFLFYFSIASALCLINHAWDWRTLLFFEGMIVKDIWNYLPIHIKFQQTNSYPLNLITEDISQTSKEFVNRTDLLILVTYEILKVS